MSEIQRASGIRRQPNALHVETRALSQKLQEQYPVRQYFHLYIGRSPVLLARELHRRAPGSGRQVAFSGAPTPYALRGAPGMARVGAPLLPDAERKLFEYFDRTIPNDAQLAGRKLVVVDYVVTGGGLKSFVSYLEEYLRARHRDVEVEAVSLVNGEMAPMMFRRDFSPLERVYRVKVKDIILEKQFPRTAALLSGGNHKVLDALSPYGHYDPAREEPPR